MMHGQKNVKLAMAWKVRNSIPVVDGLFPPSLLYKKKRIPSQCIKRPGNDTVHPSLYFHLPYPSPL